MYLNKLETKIKEKQEQLEKNVNIICMYWIYNSYLKLIIIIIIIIIIRKLKIL